MKDLFENLNLPEPPAKHPDVKRGSTPQKRVGKRHRGYTKPASGQSKAARKTAKRSRKINRK